MAVYVDHMKAGFGRMKMSHMVADSIEELLEMADRIGVARKWFQPGSHPHFDVAQSKRALAVRAGAIEVDRKELVDVMKRYRERMESSAEERAAFENARRQAVKT